ncbi:membrane protein BRI3 [Leptinotarsa decemlineata]|uniref:membrane protein BRI3 n=1 Tax=Leptinotarsa decemlineata TaxID=7539 RepID=UPI000C252D94|nr:brain protein I3 [Leptinotarsa decemlineata]
METKPPPYEGHEYSNPGYGNPPYNSAPQQPPFNPMYHNPPPNPTIIMAPPAPQTTTNVIVTGGGGALGGCPICHNNSWTGDYSCCAWCLAICFFPIGILCCLCMRSKKCSKCGYTIG